MVAEPCREIDATGMNATIYGQILVCNHEKWLWP